MSGLNFLTTSSGKQGTDQVIETDSKDSETKQVPESVEPTGDVDFVIYTSHPIQKFRLGEWKFQDATLKLTPEEAERFDEVLASQPERERALIRKIDSAKGELIAAEYLKTKQVRGIDTTLNSFSS